MHRSVTALVSLALGAVLALPAAPQPRPETGPETGAGAGLRPGGVPSSGDSSTGIDARRTGIPRRIEPEERFGVRERDLFRSWYAAEYGRGQCPPGLAKKGTECLLPGAANKRYQIGTPLPAAIRIAPLPLDLARRLGSPPIGYRYAIVDGDLLKLTLETTLVVDAVRARIP
jgi:hypothetical protein